MILKPGMVLLVWNPSIGEVATELSRAYGQPPFVMILRQAWAVWDPIRGWEGQKEDRDP